MAWSAFKSVVLTSRSSRLICIAHIVNLLYKLFPNERNVCEAFAIVVVYIIKSLFAKYLKYAFLMLLREQFHII